jgi:hypothetical protein
MTGTIAKMQAAADKLDAYELGYDQGVGQRWNIRKGGECDCSSLSGTIISMGGYPIDLRVGGFSTRNFAPKAKAAGFKVLRFIDLSQVRPGDFLLTPGHHVVFVRSANQYLSAESNEGGTALGGNAGDQMGGKEVYYRSAYNRSGGWTYIVRPPDSSTSAAAKRSVLRRGMKGDDVKAMQTRLIAAGFSVGQAGADGDFGVNTEAAVKALQKKAKIEVDGEFGPISHKALKEMSKPPA